MSASYAVVVPFSSMRSFPRGLSSSRTNSRPDNVCGAISSTNAPRGRTSVNERAGERGRNCNNKGHVGQHVYEDCP